MLTIVVPRDLPKIPDEYNTRAFIPVVDKYFNVYGFYHFQDFCDSPHDLDSQIYKERERERENQCENIFINDRLQWQLYLYFMLAHRCASSRLVERFLS